MLDNRDYWTVRAMEKFGGSFVKALASAAERADHENLEKIKDAWPEYWTDYEVMGSEMEDEQPPRSEEI